MWSLLCYLLLDAIFLSASAEIYKTPVDPAEFAEFVITRDASLPTSEQEFTSDDDDSTQAKGRRFVLVAEQTIHTVDEDVTKQKYVQAENGIPVDDTTVTATAGHNFVDNVVGHVYSPFHPDVVSPNLTEYQAQNVAFMDFASKAGIAIQNLVLHAQNLNTKLRYRPELGTLNPVYDIDFFVEEAINPTRPFYIIDALTGVVLDDWEGLDSDTYVNGTGPGGNVKASYEYGKGDLSGFPVKKVGTVCSMDTENVKTVNMNHGTKDVTQAFAYECNGTDNRNEYKPINEAKSPLNDAHFFGMITFNMFKDYANVAPLKFQLVLRVHYSRNYQNAFWDGRKMTFGDGASTFYPLVDLNVVTHEAAHGFTGQNSGLVYRGMSGGMNEAYSDIAGEAAEYYLYGKVDWKVGYRIFKGNGALRYFDVPSRDGKSINHAKDYRTGLNVHYSSGVYNRAFYLLCNNENWTIEMGFKIFTLANQMYWTSSSTFNEGACGVERAAKDYKYPVADVTKAFAEVGVFCAEVPTEAPPQAGTEAECNFDTNNYCNWIAEETKRDGGTYKYNKWVLQKGKTQSHGTGPDMDVGGSGYYAYMEASHSGSSAPFVTLKSHKITTIANECLRFSYHMKGIHVGSLRILKRYDKGPVSTEIIFEKSGAQGNGWIQATVPIAPSQDFTLEVVASKKMEGGWSSDIAVDDFTFVPCNENPAPSSPVGPSCLEEGVDYHGNDQKVITSVFSWFSCYTLCQHDDSCKFWSWTDDTNKVHSSRWRCVFKTTDGGRQDVPSSVSAARTCTVTSGTVEPPTHGPQTNPQTPSPDTRAPSRRSTQTPTHSPTRSPTRRPSPTGRPSPTRRSTNRPTNGPTPSLPPARPDVHALEVDFSRGQNIWKMLGGFWKLSSSYTKSFNTGPKQPFMRRRPPAMYAYVDSTFPNYHRISSLESSWVDLKEDVCFSHMYHMYGKDIGSFELVAEYSSGIKKRLMNVEGNEANAWKFVSHDLKKIIGNSVKLTFNITTKAGPEGDIAMGNFRVTKGPCTKPKTFNCAGVNSRCRTTPKLRRENEKQCLGNISTTGINWSYEQCNINNSNEPVMAGVTVDVRGVAPGRGACLRMAYRAVNSPQCHITLQLPGYGKDGNVGDFLTADEGILQFKEFNILPRESIRNAKVELLLTLDPVNCARFNLVGGEMEDRLCR